MRDLMVRERVLLDREWRYGFQGVLVTILSTQIVNLNHLAMVFLQECNDIVRTIAIEGFKTRSGVARCNDTVRDVGEIQVVLAGL